jgi:hypothetical protein
MSKLTDIDIHLIKECIKAHCLTEINKDLRDKDSICGRYIPGDDYSVHQKHAQEAERLIALMDTLKEENV